MPERARRLSRASAELLSELDLDRVLTTVVGTMRFLMRADAASVSLADDAGTHLVLKAGDGLSDEYLRTTRVPVEAARRLYQGPEQHLIIDLAASPVGDTRVFEAEGLAKVIAFPLVRRGELIGALNAYLRDASASFPEENLDLAHVLAAEASIAIANAHMYQEALREHALQRALVGSLGTPVLVARPPGVLVAMNQMARDLTGLPDDVDMPLREAFAGLHMRDATTREPLTRTAMSDALNGEEWEGEVVFERVGTGDERYAHVVVRPVRDDTGAVIASAATMHDLTELRRVQQEQEQFLSIVSHELRTPLTPLKALAQLLISRIKRSRERGQPLDLESFERNLSSIERQVDRMNGLVSDLLSVSRAGRGILEMDRRPFDLALSVRDIVERYVQATREEGRHQFAVDAPETLTVNADQARVEQMLMNLIGNAVKYSPRGGKVRVSLARQNGSAEIRIADEGIGITAEDLPRLGAAFTRGSGKASTFAGMGIGLHVAKLLSEAHGGSLQLESPGEDRGTTVRVTLPT